MHYLQNWLLELAKETMAREGSEDAAHDFDHLVRVMAIADTIRCAKVDTFRPSGPR